MSLGGRVSRAVHNKGVIIAGAVETTAIECVQDILADLLGGGEVIGRVGGGEKLPGGNLDVVNTHVARGIGHVQRMVQDRTRFFADEGTEVPVDVV